MYTETDTNTTIELPAPAPPTDSEASNTAGSATANPVAAPIGADAATRDRFVAALAEMNHDLHGPLATLKGFVQILLGDTAGIYDAEKRQQFLTIINNQCDRAAQNVDDIVRAARAVSGQPQKGDVERLSVVGILHRLVEEARAQTAKAGSKTQFNVTIVTLQATNGTLPEVQAREWEMTEAFTELIHYAASIYTESTVHIAVTGSEEGSNTPFVEVRISTTPTEGATLTAAANAHGFAGKMGIGPFLASRYLADAGGAITGENAANFMVRLPCLPPMASEVATGA